MKSHTEYLWFNTKKHREFINITEDVEKALAKSQIKEGLILVSAMHITAGVYINDAEEGLIADIDEWLESWRLSALITATTTPARRTEIRT